MEIKQLMSFYTIAKTGSFSQAARTLNYAQPTITSHIQSLEQELNVPLFDRLGKRISLTIAGEKLLAYAEQLIHMEAEAKSIVTRSADEPKGDLTVAASGSILSYHLPPVFGEYKRLHTSVRLKIYPSTHVDLVQAVAQGAANAGVVYRQSLPDTVDYIKLRGENLSLVCSPDYPLAQNSKIKPQELANYDLLMQARGCPIRHYFEGVMKNYDIMMEAVFEFVELAPIKRYARNGMGVALIPQTTIIDELNRGELVLIEWLGESLVIPIWYIWHRDKWQSPAQMKFREVVIDILAKDVYSQIS